MVYFFRYRDQLLKASKLQRLGIGIWVRFLENSVGFTNWENVRCPTSSYILICVEDNSQVEILSFLSFLQIRQPKCIKWAQTPAINPERASCGKQEALGSKSYMCQSRKSLFSRGVPPLFTEFPIVGVKSNPTIPSFHATWLEF